MSVGGSGRWLREARRAMARLPRLARVPDAPVLVVRDPWPGDPQRGARLLKGEIEIGGGVSVVRPGAWVTPGAPDYAAVAVHGFAWLRDLRALGSDAARLRARALVLDWISGGGEVPVARRPEATGARLASWLMHYDFFAASADDAFRQRLMAQLVADARALALALPGEAVDSRALTALKGLFVAAVALPEGGALMARGLRTLPHELGRQVLADGCHAERSPASQLSALQDAIEVRALLQSAGVEPPGVLATAIEKLATALRSFRHGDGGASLFNGGREDSGPLIEAVLAQVGRSGRAPTSLPEGGFERLQAGRSVLIVDCGAPPGPGLDQLAQAGTLGMEVSVGRDRLIVGCGAAPGVAGEWRDALRNTAAHSTLVMGDLSSSEVRGEAQGGGLGRRPRTVRAWRHEANGAHWLEASHDGWTKPFGAVHRRRLYLSETGEDLRGEDSVDAAEPVGFTIRFHLHPSVKASLQQDASAVLLRPPSGGGWRLRADGARLALEESVYFGCGSLRRSEQVTLNVPPDGPRMVKWGLGRVG